MPTQKKLRQAHTKKIRKLFREKGFACTIPQASKVRAALKKDFYSFTSVANEIFPDGFTMKATGEKFTPVGSWQCGDKCCGGSGGVLLKAASGWTLNLVEYDFLS